MEAAAGRSGRSLRKRPQSSQGGRRLKPREQRHGGGCVWGAGLEPRGADWKWGKRSWMLLPSWSTLGAERLGGLCPGLGEGRKGQESPLEQNGRSCSEFGVPSRPLSEPEGVRMRLPPSPLSTQQVSRRQLLSPCKWCPGKGWARAGRAGGGNPSADRNISSALGSPCRKFEFNPKLGIDNPVLSLAEDHGTSGNPSLSLGSRPLP